MADLMVRLTSTSEHSATVIAPSTEIGRALGRFDAKLVPVGTDPDTSAHYYRVEGFAAGDIDDLRTSLERLNGVEAVYIKPSDELP